MNHKIIKRRNLDKKRVIIYSVTSLFLSSIILFFLYFMVKSLSFDSKPLDLEDDELGIIPKTEEMIQEYHQSVNMRKHENAMKEEVFHIALFGLDRRNPSDQNSRSDAIMIATLDSKNQKIKLSSLMRDQYVEIEGYGKDKLNHAYAYGGPALAIQTINKSFGTNIRHYATVDFFTLEKIINVLGGVEMNVKKNEVSLLNKHLKEMEHLTNKKVAPYEYGQPKLSGEQAVAYSRIRYVGNGDFERSDRQRLLLKVVANDMKKKNIFELTKIWVSIAPYIETSVTKSQALDIAQTFLTLENKEIEEMRFPVDGTWSSKRTENGMWVMEIDTERQKELIQKFLYGSE